MIITAIGMYMHKDLEYNARPHNRTDNTILEKEGDRRTTDYEQRLLRRIEFTNRHRICIHL